jgi:uncharacterized protein (DUF1778 family)
MTTIVRDRIDIRISRRQKELIKYASDLSGFKSLSEFIIYCVNKESNKIIVENDQILKSIEDKRIFLDAILNPPTPNDDLKKAYSNYQKLIIENEYNNNRTGKEIQ